MNDVIRAVDRIRSLPGTLVDRNFRQGRDAVLAQLNIRTEGEIDDVSVADEYIAHIQEGLAEVHAWVEPYRLPDDYVFFLEFYGGLFIETASSNLLVLGIGPMVEEWYGFIKGDEGAYENGWLLIAGLSLSGERVGQYVDFFMDLAGTLCPYCVIGVTSWGPGGSSRLPVVQNLDAYPTRWTKLADSFTEWLERVAETGGTLGYD
jgi:hypothetical protein